MGELSAIAILCDTMKKVIKGMWSYIFDVLLDEYNPDDLDFFGLWINLRIGPDDAQGAHDYQLLVCTQKWLKNECDSLYSLWSRHMLIVNEYDISLIKMEIIKCIDVYCAEE